MFLPACDVLHSKERPCRKLAGAYREVMRLWFSFSVSRSRPCGFLYKVWSFCSATFQFASEIDRAREWESVYLTGRAGSLPSCKKKKKSFRNKPNQTIGMQGCALENRSQDLTSSIAAWKFARIVTLGHELLLLRMLILQSRKVTNFFFFLSSNINFTFDSFCADFWLY